MKNEKLIQDVTSTFLFYACIIISTMLTALSAIEDEQANPTKNHYQKQNNSDIIQQQTMMVMVNKQTPQQNRY